ncbi:LytTR family transcriptional regulator DNA-binding domain-containing protein [Pontibacter sp. MBLB2868]|uniref:LytTR family transcriptional regulator DNA-binding domain-containing protein n=1 Tax=Pontibacter sp. MBLB2868 TaxID=3451555 RepID=UPI003F75200C
MTITEAGDMLPESKFIRVHRSYIVAKDKIDKIECHQVCIKGNEVPVDASYMQLLQGV